MGLMKVILLLLVSFLHNVSAATIDSGSIQSITYADSITQFRIISQSSYDDGTILLRFSPISTHCNEQKLYLRLIHLDGSIKELNIDVFQIPLSNFCLLEDIHSRVADKSSVPPLNDLTTTNPNNLIEDYIKVYAISPGYIMVTYYCGLSSNFNLCGMTINWDGTILNVKELEDACTDSEIVRNINSGGFLWLCHKQGLNQLNWQKFNIHDDSGSFESVGSGTLMNVNKFTRNLTQVFATEDGGYGIVMAQYQAKSNVDFIPPWTIDIAFIPSTSNTLKGPFQIYSQTTENVRRLDIYKCNIAYYSYGYSCIIHIIRSSGQKVFVNIDLLSSGSILNTTEFTIADEAVGSTVNVFVWDVLPLYYGGLIILTDTPSNNDINGIIYSNRGTFYSDWNMPSGRYQFTKNVGVFLNNTIWVIANDGNKWTLVTSSLFSNYSTIQGGNSMVPGGPGGYGNAFVGSTIPSINSIVTLMSTQKLQIKYTNNIQLSNGNLSIIDANNNVIRQTFNSKNNDHIKEIFVRLIDNRTVEIDVLETTFNRKNSPYYILVDNGFVKDANFDQALLGIRKNIWRLSTNNNGLYTDESFLGSTSAMIRLSSMGTKYFTSLSTKDRLQFSKELSYQLSLVIPCDATRISTTSKYQLDKDSSTRRILFRVYVQKSKGDVSSSQIVKDLDLLLRKRDHNAMSMARITSLLDASYGAKLTPDLKRYSYIIIGVALGFIILFVLYYIARKKDRDANNKTIFTFTFIIIDFILDIAFIINHGNDLHWISPTSIAFIVIPILLNCSFTYIIISREIKDHNRFSRWWIKNSKTALVFTSIFAVADLEALNLMSSRCSGLIGLSAPLMKRTEHYIFIFNTISILIEDFPQLLILIIYQAYTILPNIIPILALSSCILVFLTKLYGSISYYVQYCKSKVPLQSFEKKPDRLDSTHSSFRFSKREEYLDPLPNFASFSEDFLKKKQKKSFFNSGQNSNDSKRNSSRLSGNSRYASDALRIFSGGNSNNNSTLSDGSDLAEQIMVLNKDNFLGRNEITGEPIFLLRDPEEYNFLPQKIKQLPFGKLVGDSIVSANDDYSNVSSIGFASIGKSSKGSISTESYNKRMSDAGIICSTDEISKGDDVIEIATDQKKSIIDRNSNTTTISTALSTNLSTAASSLKTNDTLLENVVNEATTKENSPRNISTNLSQTQPGNTSPTIEITETTDTTNIN
ncbi:17608_t:CDS:2 [Funneliformis caledonium]|uniref:17608_t:CDS:1 n=1 Tax=Funneliformis caledonium TaxID=1117310 RepID=A0A9N8YVI9_9GLOM|nr:17608_t:CDS:2 [Funneliformis caledonium]